MAIGEPNVPRVPYPRGFISVDKAGVIVLNAHEETLDENGLQIEGSWISPPFLNSVDPTAEFRLHGLSFQYSAPANASFGIDISPDGGETWTYTENVVLPATVGNQLLWYKHWREITGVQIIFRLRMFSNHLVSVYRYSAFVTRNRVIFR